MKNRVCLQWGGGGGGGRGRDGMGGGDREAGGYGWCWWCDFVVGGGGWVGARAFRGSMPSGRIMIDLIEPSGGGGWGM